MRVSIKAILRNLGKNKVFLQPLFEAISNSLEANATKIEVSFSTDSSLFNKNFGVINGFSVWDNGDGFNKKNLNAFEELWTDNKLEIGCKGSGRFTWLTVFENVVIESSVEEENKHIDIIFSKDFDIDKDIKKRPLNKDEKNGTTIIFKNVTADFFSKNRDSRSICNLELIKKDITEYLFVKLFLLKQAGKDFTIILKNNGNEESITNDSIPKFNERHLEIKSEITTELFEFILFYLIKRDGCGNKSVFFCTDSRTIMKNEADKMGLASNLPKKESLFFLITSDYLNGKSDAFRDGFKGFLDDDFPSIECPLTLNRIREEVKKVIKDILSDEVPLLNDQNNKEIEKARTKAPYLTTYIKKNDDVVQNADNLIKSAKKMFEKEKDTIRSQFENLLKEKKISSESFINGVEQISRIATEELGEYILYRDAIIDALRKSIDDDSKKEDFIHNIIIPKRKVITAELKERHYLSNLWLLDDKFMTFSTASSDISIKQICDQLFNQGKKGSPKRPDVSVFFGNKQKDDCFDALIVELKGSYAGDDEKNKAITELPDNIGELRKVLPKIKTIWGYTIVKFDDRFKNTLQNNDFLPLFSSDSSYYVFYRYHKNINAHIYVLDLESVISDASSRNSTFLNILTKEY